MTLTTGKTAAKYHLSRTALLYYDKLGLVSPTARSANGYRMYNDEDQLRLRQVLLYREIGVPLEQIRSLLTDGQDHVHSILFGRLSALGDEIAVLKARQLTVIAMMAENLRGSAHDGAALESLLHSAGMGREQARQMHRNLEQSSPLAHERFLQALGFTPDEVAEIRQQYAAAPKEGDHETPV